MKIVGIICEYHPFHLGHARQIACIRERYGADAAVVCVMSGNYVQRGEAAMFDKYTRAYAALANGCDLIAELPYPWSCAQAPFFAAGGIALLRAMGCIDAVCFGSETGDAAYLRRTARRLSSPDFAEAMRRSQETRDGAVSDIRHREAVYRALYGEGLPAGANDMLGAEYLIAMERTGFAAEPFVLRREGGWSATALREAMRAGKTAPHGLPSGVPDILRTAHRPDPTVLAHALLTHFLLTPPERYADCEGAGGGMAYRIARAAQTCTTADGLLRALACKSLTHAALRRTLWHCLFSVTRDDLRTAPERALILGMTERGKACLARMRKSAVVPVVTRPARYVGSQAQTAKKAATADGLYALACGCSADHFLREAPRILQTDG